MMECPTLSDLNCPLCGSRSLFQIGPTVHGTQPRVAGIPIDLGEYGKWLLRCSACKFAFKYPWIPDSLLSKCYQTGSGDQWELEPDPRIRQFEKIGNILECHSRGKRILDIGCFNGAFLNFIGDKWSRFGVEPNKQAVHIAESRGITIVAPTLDLVPTSASRFDAIISLDVAEHVRDPLTFFRHTAKLLSPNGIILTMTGNSASYIWRLHKNRTWYANLPEHISFFCKDAMAFIAVDLNMDLIDFQTLPHKRRSAAHRSISFARHVAHALGANIARISPTIRSGFLDGFLQRSAPPCFSLADHFVAVFGRKVIL